MLKTLGLAFLLHAVTVGSTFAAQDYALQINAGGYVEGSNPHLPQGNSPITLEAWVNSDSTSIQTIFNYGNVINNERMGILLLNSHLYVVGQYNDIQGSIYIPPQTWTHVAATYDGATVKLYVNGVLDTATPFPLGSHNTTGTNWRIGLSSVGSFEPFSGLIDEVRVWNVARSPTEIVDTMNGCVAGNVNALVANYRLDDGPGSDFAKDSSGSLAAGVLVNLDASQSWVSSAPVSCNQVQVVDLTCAAGGDCRLSRQGEGGAVLPSDGPDALFYRPGTQRSRIAADGSTLFLLRARSDVAVTFQLKDALSADPPAGAPCLLGTLMTRSGQNKSCQSDLF